MPESSSARRTKRAPSRGVCATPSRELDSPAGSLFAAAPDDAQRSGHGIGTRPLAQSEASVSRSSVDAPGARPFQERLRRLPRQLPLLGMEVCSRLARLPVAVGCVDQSRPKHVTSRWRRNGLDRLARARLRSEAGTDSAPSAPRTGRSPTHRPPHAASTSSNGSRRAPRSGPDRSSCRRSRSTAARCAQASASPKRAGPASRAREPTPDTCASMLPRGGRRTSKPPGADRDPRSRVCAGGGACGCRATPASPTTSADPSGGASGGRTCS
jgi:hypothetical protein